jgi:hypothetical protein
VLRYTVIRKSSKISFKNDNQRNTGRNN